MALGGHSIGVTRAATLLRWTFPLVGLSATLASQIALPWLLQRHLSEGEYTAYVAVTSLAAYLGLADGGLLLSTVREMSALHAARDYRRFAGEVRRAKRVFAGTAIVGCGIAAVSFHATMTAASKAWNGVGPSFTAAVVEVVLATALLLGFGSYHSALLQSTGRLLTAQIVSLANLIAPLVVFVVALALTRDLAWGLHVYAASMLITAAYRAWDGRRLVRLELAGVEPARPPRPLHHLLTSGLAYKAADVLPNSAYPQRLAALAPLLVPAVMPARTYTNGCRLVSQQFLYLLQVHVTRRLAGSPEERARGWSEYHEAASALSALHLLAVALAALLAVPAFDLWLPRWSHSVQDILPGLLAEQALLAGSMPAMILLTASGRLRALGLARLGGALAGLLIFELAFQIVPVASFGIGFTASAIPLFVMGCWTELRPADALPRRRQRTVVRYALALLAACGCAFYARHPVLIGAGILIGSLVLLPASIRGIWQMARGARSS